jgi:hypothetical protein
MGIIFWYYPIYNIPWSQPRADFWQRENWYQRATNFTVSNFTIVLYYALRKSRYNGIRLCCFTSSQATKRS